jgi:hypothetical protein
LSPRLKQPSPKLSRFARRSRRRCSSQNPRPVKPYRNCSHSLFHPYYFWQRWYRLELIGSLTFWSWGTNLPRSVGRSISF